MTSPPATPRRRITSVPILTPDFRGFQTDPVGAGLNALQQALAHGVRIADQKAGERQEEGLKQLDVFVKAHVQAGVEKEGTSLADQFQQQTGISVHSLTPSATRIFESGNGRIRGTKYAQELEDRVTAGEFSSPQEFSQAFNDRISLLDEEVENANIKTGFLEMVAPRYQDLQGVVFTRSVEQREQQGKNVMSGEWTTSFDDMATSLSEDNVGTFAERLIDIDENLRLTLPSATDAEVEQVHIDSLATAVLRGEHIDEIGTGADVLIEMGLVKSSDGKKAVRAIEARAEEKLEADMQDGTPAQKKALLAMDVKVVKESLKNDGPISDDLKKEYLNAGGHTAYAAGRLSQLTTNMRNYSKDAGQAGPPPTTADKVTARQLRINKDPDAILAHLTEDPGFLPRMMRGGPEGERLVDNLLTVSEQLDAGKDNGAFRAYEDIDEWGARAGWDTDVRRDVQMRLTRILDTDPKMEPSEIDTVAQRLLKEEDAHQEKLVQPKDIEDRGPRDSGEADVLLQLFREEEAELRAQYEATVAFEQISDEARRDLAEKPKRPGGRVRVPRERGEGAAENFRIHLQAIKERKVADQTLKKAITKRQKLERRRKLLFDSEQKNQNLTPEGRFSNNVFTGSASNDELVNDLR